MTQTETCDLKTRQTIMTTSILRTVVFLSVALLCCPSAFAQAERQALADAMRASLRDELFAPWYPCALDTEHGGYLSDFAYDWEPTGEQHKMIVTQARHVWGTAKAATFFPEARDAYLGMAAHGVAFLRDMMWDHEHGGFHSFVTRDGALLETGGAFTQGKTAYGNAFAIYGLAAYAAASGDTAALELAKETFRWLETHLHDPVYGGYFQFVGNDGQPLREGWGDHPPKDQNNSIHLLEAFTELYAIWPDALLRERLEEMLVLVRDTLTATPGYLQLFFQEEWTPVSFADSSEAVRRANYYLDHVSYGHDIETAYLMLEAAHALGIDPTETLRKGKQMVDHALASGWDAETGGFYNGGMYFDADAPPVIVNDGKEWWAQAEGLNVLLVMADYFPDDAHRYFDVFEQQWEYITTYLIDHEHGGWYLGGLDAQPELEQAPKGSIWKSAYHDGRALMNCIRRLEGEHE